MRNAFIVSAALLLVGTLGGGYTAYRMGTHHEEQMPEPAGAESAAQSPVAEMNNAAVNTDAGGGSGETSTAAAPEQSGAPDQAANLAPNESTTIPDPTAAGLPGTNPDSADSANQTSASSGSEVAGGAAAGQGGSADNVPAAAQNGEGAASLPNGSNEPAGRASAAQGAFVNAKDRASGQSPNAEVVEPTSATNPSGDQPAPGNQSGAAGSGDADAGKLLYTGAKKPEVNCAVCHGAGGKGGVGANLTTADGPKSWTEAQFLAALRQGQAPEKMLNAVMPRFSEAQLSDGEINDIHAFIKALP